MIDRIFHSRTQLLRFLAPHSSTAFSFLIICIPTRTHFVGRRYDRGVDLFIRAATTALSNFGTKSKFLAPLMESFRSSFDKEIIFRFCDFLSRGFGSGMSDWMVLSPSIPFCGEFPLQEKNPLIRGKVTVWNMSGDGIFTVDSTSCQAEWEISEKSTSKPLGRSKA